MSRRLALLLLVTAVTAAGCALVAKKTPTPASDIDRKKLAVVDPPPNERYYLLLFGSESHPKRAKTTHTWATLVTATDTPGSGPTLDVQTISWLPTELPIKPTRFQPEPGRNYGLHETLDEMLRSSEELAMWGPYEIWHGLAYRFRVQKAFLDSGQVGYQLVDSVGGAGRLGTGCDCIHAVTDMDPEFGRGRYPLLLFGLAGTNNFVRRLMTAPAVIDPPNTHDWLIPALGLEQYPITRRKYHGRSEPWTREAVIRAAERTGK